MHICFLCNEYPPGQHGGIGGFTQTLGRALAARGHRVTVMGLYPSGSESVTEDEGVHVIRLKHTDVPKAGFIINGSRLRSALKQLHREHPIDLLEGPEASLAMLPSAFSVPRLIRMHGGHHFFAVTLGNSPRPWRSWLEARSFNRADHLCAVSHFVAETTRKLVGLGERLIKVLPNPVDVSLFQPHEDEAEIAGLILFIGTVCEKKGVRQLVQAMPEIIAAAPHARLWVVGRDGVDAETGKSFTDLLCQSLSPDLALRVEFKGAFARTDLPELMAKAQVCVYPSHMEAMPLAWLEGMAMQKALVVSRTGPGAEVVADGVSGLLCDPHDPSAIADQVIRLLKDESLRHRLGSEARQRTLHSFSLDSIVVRNEQFYVECISKQANTQN